MTGSIADVSSNPLGYQGLDPNVNPPFINADRIPTTYDIYNPGTQWQDNSQSPALIYETTGAGDWALSGSSSSALNTLSDTANTTVTPSAGNIKIAGTSNQVAVTAGSHLLTLSLVGPYTPATYTAHGVLIGEGTSSVVATAAGTTGQVLIGSTGADPAFGSLGVNSGLTAHGVLLGENNSAIVATAAGTTGQVLIGSTGANPAFGALGVNSGLTAHGVLLGENTSAIVATAAGTAGQLLVSGGASADPTWTTATFPATAGSTGTILRSDGTNWVASTDTYPNTVVAGDILIATATNVVGSLADVATGELLTSGGIGVAPSYTGSPSVSGSLTAATTVTATLGAITATNGNVVLGTAGNKITIATGSNASVGLSDAMSGTPGAVIVSTTASSASALIFYSRATTGGTPGHVSITAQDGTGFTLTSTGNETSTFNWWIINA